MYQLQIVARARLRLARANAIVATLCFAGTAVAQITDQVVLFGLDDSFHYQIARFDRRLNLLGMTQTSFVGAGTGSLEPLLGTAVDGQGRYWVPFDALNDTKLLRMEANGDLILPSVNLQHNPNFLDTTPWDKTYSLTRIPLLSPGPLYAVEQGGSVLGSSFAGPSLFGFYPPFLATTPAGDLWIGGPAHVGLTYRPLLVQVSPATGAVLNQMIFPKPDGATGIDAFLNSLAIAPDGTTWSFFETWLTHLDGVQIVQQAPTFETYGYPLLIDAAGNPLAVGGVHSGPGGDIKTKLERFDPTTLAIKEVFQVGGAMTGVALGATGEEAYASAVKQVVEAPKRLYRISLITGTISSVSLDALGIQWDIPAGDPTGFIWANVKDQQGDADGDGATNRAETSAGSNPFDPTSRPEGPKVYVSFVPVTNALVLTYKDPDGLLDPVGGLDLSTLSVTIANYGNVFWLLAPFVTALDLSPDGKQATLTYGALPLPFDKKWQVDATISDLTGATGWDWQVTPPGDL